MRGAILDSRAKGTGVPRSVREKAKKIETAYQQLEQKYLRGVSDSEMSDYLDVTEKEFRHMPQGSSGHDIDISGGSDPRGGV